MVSRADAAPGAGGATGLVLRRLVGLLPLVWLVATLTFAIVQLTPGSYADALDNPRLGPEARAAIQARYGLDQPMHRQYLAWLGGVARGDLGTSFLYRRPVTEVILQALGPTALLAGSALLLDLALGLVLAVAAVRRPHGWVDRTLTVLGLGLYGMPTFWLAFLAVALFSVTLGWLPSAHMHDVAAVGLGPWERLLDLLRHLVLPASCLGLVGAAVTGRFLRTALLDLRGAPFVLAARARGLSERRILWVHTLRPALLPVITLMGLSLPVLVSGSVVIETIFAWPGTGRVLWEAATARDVPLIMGLTLLASVAVIVGNLLADLLYLLADPRTREGGR